MQNTAWYVTCPRKCLLALHLFIYAELLHAAATMCVCQQGWLLEYFTSRDVTLNEVLILKHAPGQAVLYYTRDAVRDAQLQLVSVPCNDCVHLTPPPQTLDPRP